MSLYLEDSMAWTELVRAIHGAPVATVMEMAGGTQGLAWLHGVPGSSATVLEAHDRYHHDALTTALGARPFRATEPRVADKLALVAWERARVLTDNSMAVVGLGCTASMVTEHQKRGSHVCHVSTWDGLGCRRSTVELTKGLRNREQEESVVGRLVLLALAAASGVETNCLPPWSESESIQLSFEAVPGLKALFEDSAQTVLRRAEGTVLVNPSVTYRSKAGAILSGSFNPLHDAHRGLKEAAAEFLGMKVSYEIPVLNADKSPLDAIETHCRAAQFLGRADLWLTHAALYSEKAILFPGSIYLPTPGIFSPM